MSALPGRLLQLLDGLTPVQQRYVRARHRHATKTAAAEAVGVNKDTPRKWPDEVEEAVELYLEQVHEAMDLQLLRAGELAMQHKVNELASSNPAIAARAATYIIDRIMGKPTQHVKQQTTVDDVSTDDIKAALDVLVSRTGEGDVNE